MMARLVAIAEGSDRHSAAGDTLTGRTMLVERARNVAVMVSNADDWCPSSGLDVGLMVETPGSDEWKIECPTCGRLWFGGSTVLDDHTSARR